MVLLTFLRKKITVNWIIINRLYTNYGFSKKTLFDYVVENDLMLELEEIFNNLEFKYVMLLEKKKIFFTLLKDVKHAKGKRLIFKLPLNGQRTKTNAKTIRKLFK